MLVRRLQVLSSSSSAYINKNKLQVRLKDLVVHKNTKEFTCQAEKPGDTCQLASGACQLAFGACQTLSHPPPPNYNRLEEKLCGCAQHPHTADACHTKARLQTRPWLASPPGRINKQHFTKHGDNDYHTGRVT